jgi:hypothetical protein
MTVPNSMTGRAIFHGIHHGLKHASIVVCISAGGDHMTPFFVSSQVHDDVTRRPKNDGFRIGCDIILRRRDMPCMNATPSAEYIGWLKSS